MKIKLQWLAATAMSLAVCAGPALAGPISIAPNNGAQEMIDDAGGNLPPWGLPLLPTPNGMTGFSTLIASGTAPNLMLTPGTYDFTYVGSGNATNHDTFTIPGSGGFTFDNQSTALGTTFQYTVTSASSLSFIYANLTAGTSISSGAVNPTSNLSYGLFMQGSTGCTTATPGNGYSCPGGSPSTGPGPVAYIGLADLPVGTDHDFQDLGIRVAVPEPATWALMLLGFGGLGAVLRGQRRRQAMAVG